MNARFSNFVIGFLLAMGSNASASTFNGMIAFGDSLSDVGNSASAAISLYGILGDNCGPTHPCPPYFNGRISNGPVATEYLVNSLFAPGTSSGNFSSYAVAGATTGVGNIGDGGSATRPGDLIPVPVPGVFPLPGLRQTMDRYMDDAGGNADPEALYFLWGGANDYLTGDSPAAAARNIGDYVGELAAAGARHILVPNLPDLSQTPFARVEGIETDARAFTLGFNEELANQLGQASSRFPLADLYTFDTYAFMNGVAANPQDYGLTNMESPCLSTPGCDPGSFLFWDDFHPTSHAHSLVASSFASAVPEPEAFAMLSGGLLVLGLIAGRRAKIAAAEDGSASRQAGGKLTQ